MNWNIFNIFKKKEKPSTVPCYDYYDFCEKFPEFLFLSFRPIYPDDLFWYPDLTQGRRVYNDLEKLDTDTKLLLVKHLKKIKKRVYFNENNIQKILLEKWKLNQSDQLEIPFDFDDNKYNELCKDLYVQYSESIGVVLRILFDIPNMFGSYNNLVSKFKYKVPIVTTASSGMRDHYGFGRDDIMTEKEFLIFIRKAKLLKLKI